MRLSIHNHLTQTAHSNASSTEKDEWMRWRTMWKIVSREMATTQKTTMHQIIIFNSTETKKKCWRENKTIKVHFHFANEYGKKCDQKIRWKSVTTSTCSLLLSRCNLVVCSHRSQHIHNSSTSTRTANVQSNTLNAGNNVNNVVVLVSHPESRCCTRSRCQLQAWQWSLDYFSSFQLARTPFEGPCKFYDISQCILNCS